MVHYKMCVESSGDDVMGNVPSSKIRRVNYEFIQGVIGGRAGASAGQDGRRRRIIINTLPDDMQHCLIPGTLKAGDDVATINGIVVRGSGEIKNTDVVLYGKNTTDAKLYEQYGRLTALGFGQGQIFVYLGGMFEWLLLQDVYGSAEFPTVGNEIDILKYRGNCADG